MEDIQSLVFVACEDVVVLTCQQHIVFFLPLHGQHFMFVFSFVILKLLLMILFPRIISLRFLVRLKDVIGSLSNILARFSFMIWETFRADLL